MVLQVLPLYGVCRAVVGTRQGIPLAHGPVSVDDVGVNGSVLSTVVTAGRTLWTLLSLVSGYGPSMEPTATLVSTLQLHKLAANQLLVFFLRVRVQVLVIFAQFSSPCAAQLAVNTANLQLSQGPLQVLIVEDCEGAALAQRAWAVSIHDLGDAVLAEVVTAAADQVRVAEDEQADRALRLNQWRRGTHKLAVIAGLKLVVLGQSDGSEADDGEGGVRVFLEAAARCAMTRCGRGSGGIHLLLLQQLAIQP